MSTTVEQLEREQQKIRDRMARRDKKQNEDRVALLRLDDAILRQKVIDLLDVKDAVKIRYQLGPESRWHHVNDKLGTVTEVRRTRMTVDFCGHKLNAPIDAIIPATEAQGFTL